MTPRTEYWARIGNFYQLANKVAWSRLVGFSYRTQNSPPILSLTICHKKDDFLELTLKLSILYDQEINSLVKEYFANIEHRITNTVYSKYVILRCYRIESQKMDPRFLQQLFALKNAHASIKAQFTDDIIQELNNIIRFLDTNDVTISHVIINNKDNQNSHLNPALKNSTEIITYLESTDKHKDSLEVRKKIHTQLTKGANPNQRDIFGLCILSFMITRMHEAELIGNIKLLLAYGASYKLRDGTGHSALEWARISKKLSAFNLFAALETQIQREISSRIKLVAANILAGHRRVFSSYRFTQPEIEIYSTFKCSHDISNEDREGLSQLYSKWFDGEAALAATFAPKDNKYIEILRDISGKVIGFVTYVLKKTDDILWCNVDLALMDEPYVQFGIMQAIIFRFPFSLQKIFPKLIIWVVFIGMHFNAFNTVAKNLKNLAWPLYQPDGQIDKISDALLNKFSYQLKIHYEPPDICYVVEKHPVIVKKAHASKVPSLKEELYQAFRDNHGDQNPEEIKKRGVITAAIISVELFENFFTIFANLGWNFGCEVLQFTDKLGKSDFFPAPVANAQLSLFRAAPLIWEGIKLTESIDYMTLDRQLPFKTDLMANLA